MMNKRKNKGIVLATVMIMVIVLSALMLSILSQNSSQTMSAQAQVDQIKAQELAIGSLYKAYADMNAGNSNPSVAAVTLDGKTFTPNIPAKPSCGSTYCSYSPSVTY